MKKLILLAVMIAGCIINAGAQTTKVSDKTSSNGTTYVSSAKRVVTSSDIETGFDWTNGKDETRYPIYLHKYTRGDNAGKWTVFVFRTSKKTGEKYKYYLPDGEAIAADIIKRKPDLIKK